MGARGPGLHPPGWPALLRACSVTQSCPTLFNPVDRSLPGSSVHGIFQERILEWVAMPASFSPPLLGEGSLQKGGTVEDCLSEAPPAAGNNFFILRGLWSAQPSFLDNTWGQSDGSHRPRPHPCGACWEWGDGCSTPSKLITHNWKDAEHYKGQEEDAYKRGYSMEGLQEEVTFQQRPETALGLRQLRRLPALGECLNSGRCGMML